MNLGGPASMAFRDFVIPAAILSEVATTLTEGVRERRTLAGTFKKGSGTLDTAEAKATLFVPSMDWLGKNILRSKYNAPTAPQTTGNIVWNSETCATLDVGPVNIHYDCEGNDNNDVFFYNAQLQVNLEMMFNATDDLSVGLTLFAQPDENGNVFRLGTGDLTQESIWDPTTETTVPVDES